MASPERFMVVAFTESGLPELQPMKGWPQHMTVFPWVTGDRLYESSRLRGPLSEFPPAEAEITGLEQYGAQNEVSVWEIKPTAIIKTLHNVIYDFLSSKAEDDTYVGINYSPYISVKPGQTSRRIGERIVLPSISIIGQEHGNKIIYEHIPLLGKL